MTPSPAVPRPNEPTYPLTALNLYPTILTGPFDPTKPLKNWARPIGTGENPSDFIVLGGYPIPFPETVPTYDASAIGMTIAQAGAVNIQPANVLPSDQASVALTTPAVLSPAAPLLTTESIVYAIGGFLVINSAYVAPAQPVTAQQSTDSATEARILAGEEELLTKEGLPSV